MGCTGSLMVSVLVAWDDVGSDARTQIFSDLVCTWCLLMIIDGALVVGMNYNVWL